MKKILNFLSIVILLFLCSSCEFLDKEEQEDGDIGKFTVEELFYADESVLLDGNSFKTTKPICNSGDYIFLGTNGSDKEPGKIIKLNKKTKQYSIITLSYELKKLGYMDNTAFFIDSLEIMEDSLIIKAERSKLMFDDGRFEIISLNKEDLSVRWRFFPEENGNISSFSTGFCSVTPWKNYLIYIYEDINNLNDSCHFYLLVLDMNGNVVAKRKYTDYRPADEDLCIYEDKLYLHQKYEPIAVYDLNKVIDTNFTNEECIDFLLRIGESSVSTANICDGTNCYTHYWDDDDKSHLCAMNIKTNKIGWDYKFENEFFDCPNVMLLKENKLIVPADYGCIYCFDSKKGVVNWKKELIKENSDNVINLMQNGCFIDNMLVLPVGDNRCLYYFNLKTGKIEGKKKLVLDLTQKQCFAEDSWLYLTNGYGVYRIRMDEK